MNRVQLDAIAAKIDADETLADLVVAQDYPAIADALNEPTTVPNPEPQIYTPKRLVLADIFGTVYAANPADLDTLRGLEGWIVDGVKEELAENDRSALMNYLAVVQSALSPESQTALSAMFSRTELDPTWTATIPGPSWAQSMGLPRVRPSDVQAVLA